MFNNLGSNHGPSGWNAGDFREAGGACVVDVHMTNKFSQHCLEYEAARAIDSGDIYDSSAEDDMTFFGGFAVRRRRSPPEVYSGSIRASNKSSL